VSVDSFFTLHRLALHGKMSVVMLNAKLRIREVFQQQDPRCESNGSRVMATDVCLYACHLFPISFTWDHQESVFGCIDRGGLPFHVSLASGIDMQRRVGDLGSVPAFGRPLSVKRFRSYGL
jgi:hypothetical protein